MLGAGLGAGRAGRAQAGVLGARRRACWARRRACWARRQAQGRWAGVRGALGSGARQAWREAGGALGRWAARAQARGALERAGARQQAR